MVFLALHGAVRGAGDEIFKPHDISRLETGIFRTSPPAWLQEHIQSHDLKWLDAACFGAYTFWFVLPVIMAFAITRKEPKQLVPFFTWIAVLTVMTDCVFLALPVSPPWMHPGVSRVLVVRAFTNYTTVDNNQFAAFPSLHAGLPMLMAAFFWFRLPEARKLAWLCAVFGVVVSFSVIYLGEHWLLDVFGGWAFAALASWLCLSPAVRKLLSRLPFDVVGSAERVNRRVFGPEDVAAPPPSPPESLPLPEAA
jgi:membrane-associated phospholipid phosphatase